MYEQFYGLKSAPFELTRNPARLLLTPTHREALSMIDYGINSRKGVTLLIGEAGTGKTTVLRKSFAMRSADGGADWVYISNPRVLHTEFLAQLAEGFGLDPSVTASKPKLLRKLEATLIYRYCAGRSTALVVDEAQCLGDELIEELRLLVNIELDQVKLLPLVLVGQPELAERLNEHHLRQFKQRVTLRCRLAPLDLGDTVAYIVGRLRLAGGDATRLFTREAIIAIYNASRGIPRTISVICDNALITGFALQRDSIDAAIINDVCRDFDFQAASPFPAATRIQDSGDSNTRFSQVSPSEPKRVLGPFRRGLMATAARLTRIAT